ncbi:TPMT family class I SAM-dependent methyltransferase [Christiangramia crocea]|uniref:TPMT family class I SAM-dependent methyltransferase n=1 Tax=Christiangramia crocea TaxID=2904124 RepID=A0A9X2A4X4_9FLAO|nr:TPMT family class I SAM-dependent methyltransferase [Gramella crocea]MCG9970755.1 TPMT family class I SAM-dependent methyltransferase [Gramella crocea]
MTGLKMPGKKRRRKIVNKEFWSGRYRENKTGWDIGHISTPIKEYIDQLDDKDLKILIPGAGNSYEAEYLFKKGFRNVTVCDIASEPLKNFRNRVPDFPESQLLQEDFFELNDSFDLILEQTFFCAIPVDKRPEYAQKAHDLLKEKAKISGVFFDFELQPDGPPFGGSKEEYLTYFSPYFKIDTLERCYNSIKPRQGNELFFKFIKK